MANLDTNRLRTREQILEVHKIIGEANRKITATVKDVLEPIGKRAREYDYIEGASVEAVIEYLDEVTDKMDEVEQELMDAVKSINDAG